MKPIRYPKKRIYNEDFSKIKYTNPIIKKYFKKTLKTDDKIHKNNINNINVLKEVKIKSKNRENYEDKKLKRELDTEYKNITISGSNIKKQKFLIIKKKTYGERIIIKSK